MKAFKSLFLVAVLGIVAVGCGKVENILPKKDGLWVGVSSTTESYVNDSLVSTEVQTDSLGQLFFAKDGTGYSTDTDGSNRTDFTWSVNEENDQITLTDTSGVPLVYDILESSNSAMTWFTTFSFNLLGMDYRSDITAELERK
jgi:hypothetical protein